MLSIAVGPYVRSKVGPRVSCNHLKPLWAAPVCGPSGATVGAVAATVADVGPDMVGVAVWSAAVAVGVATAVGAVAGVGAEIDGATGLVTLAGVAAGTSSVVGFGPKIGALVLLRIIGGNVLPRGFCGELLPVNTLVSISIFVEKIVSSVMSFKTRRGFL